MKTPVMFHSLFAISCSVYLVILSGGFEFYFHSSFFLIIWIFSDFFEYHTYQNPLPPQPSVIQQYAHYQKDWWRLSVSVRSSNRFPGDSYPPCGNGLCSRKSQLLDDGDVVKDSSAFNIFPRELTHKVICISQVFS